MKLIEPDNQSILMRQDLAPYQRIHTKDKPGKKKSSSPSAFDSLLQEAQEPDTDGQASSEALDAAVDDIHGLGEQLARHPGPEQIRAYKKALRKVLESFVQNGLVTEKHVSNRNVLQQKSYQMIKIIDEKLERLVVGILQSQYSQIEVLSRIEEIQGLLVNLLH